MKDVEWQSLTVEHTRLELTIWFVPSLYENAIAVAFVGVALGPIYPIVMNVASVLLPRRFVLLSFTFSTRSDTMLTDEIRILTGAIGWIAR